jgi:hypothetical protein
LSPIEQVPYLLDKLNKHKMNNKEPEYIYILTNPSFREDWVKIGKSARPVDVRSKDRIRVPSMMLLQS